MSYNLDGVEILVERHFNIYPNIAWLGPTWLEIFNFSIKCGQVFTMAFHQLFTQNCSLGREEKIGIDRVEDNIWDRDNAARRGRAEWPVLIVDGSHVLRLACQ